MKLTRIYNYKNFLAYVLLFAFVNIVNYIPDNAFYEAPIENNQSSISDFCDEETMPTSIVEIVFEDFFHFPESKFSYEDIKDFSTRANRYSSIAKSIETPHFILLPGFLNVSVFTFEQYFNTLSTGYSQFVNTLSCSTYFSFVHLLYPF